MLAVALSLVSPPPYALRGIKHGGPGAGPAGSASEAAAAELEEAARIAERTLHPSPALLARVQRELGRLLRRRAATQSIRANLSWGGASSAGAAVAEAAAEAEEGAEEPAPPAPAMERAAAPLLGALAGLGASAWVEPELQSQVCLELSLLHGARLQPGGDERQLGLAAAYLAQSAVASAARRALASDLPAAAAAPLDGALPPPLAAEVAEAAALLQGAEGAGTSSRELLSMVPAAMRAIELPHADQVGGLRCPLLTVHGSSGTTRRATSFPSGSREGPTRSTARRRPRPCLSAARPQYHHHHHHVACEYGNTGVRLRIRSTDSHPK